MLEVARCVSSLLNLASSKEVTPSLPFLLIRHGCTAASFLGVRPKGLRFASALKPGGGMTGAVPALARPGGGFKAAGGEGGKDLQFVTSVVERPGGAAKPGGGFT